MRKILTEKRKQTSFYMSESNIEFLETLKYKLRKEKVSTSDIVNLAIESFKKQHLADEKQAKEPKEE